MLAERIATRLGALLERRVSRRSAVARAAVAGSAFAVAPIRYLVRPGTAWAVIGPGNCSSGLCTDGYTAFCCEIEHGRNTCPTGTYVAGWWKCTSYQGHHLCRDVGVRYYIDCNRKPGAHVSPAAASARTATATSAASTATSSATASATRRSTARPRLSAGS